MAIQGNGDRLASGRQRSATFQGGFGDGELKPSVAPEGERVPDLVDNSALFTPTKPATFYRGRPFSDRVLIKRLPERQSNSRIVIPDVAKGKSDIGVIVSMSPFCKLNDHGVKPGSIVLIDGYATIGMWFDFADENGEVSQHLVLQESDIIMELTEHHNVLENPVQ